MIRRPSRVGAKGFTLVEVVTASAILGSVMLAAVSLGGGSLKSAAGIATSQNLSVRAAEATDVVARELQIAGIAGEDVNENGLLDAGEDTNRNGRLDADWSLPDGATSGSITFNVIGANWLWGPPITYDVAGGILRRTQGTSVREICRNVKAFSVSRNGSVVDVVLTLGAVDRTGKPWTVTGKRRVDVRN